jgi:hypothetical protein
VYSADSTRIASASSGNTVKIWDAFSFILWEGIQLVSDVLYLHLMGPGFGELPMGCYGGGIGERAGRKVTHGNLKLLELHRWHAHKMGQESSYAVGYQNDCGSPARLFGIDVQIGIEGGA